MLSSLLGFMVSDCSSVASSKRKFGLLGFTLSAVLLSSGASAQRYIVTDDAFGNANAKQISKIDEAELESLKELASASSDAANEDETSKVTLEASEATTSETAQKLVEASDAQEAPAAEITLQSAALENSELANGAASSLPLNTRDGKVQTATIEENPFEKALRESQENETDEVIKRLRARGGDSDFDATKVDPAEFVDSEDLLQGNVDSDGDRPFFVTFDSEGESNVIFYSPQVIQQEINRREREEVVSDAVFHTRADKGSSIQLPEGADPVAARILASGGQKSYFEQFTERCCERLPNVGILKLRTDKPLHVPLAKDDFSYRFVDGDSRYRIVRLPDVRKNYLITVKTFVKAYKREGIRNGAFIPQLIMLDRDKNVLRIINDITTESHAETWTKYGYLKSVVEVQQSDIDAEAMLLVYTRSQDLRRVSRVEDSSGTWEIKHMEIGAIEVAVVENTL